MSDFGFGHHPARLAVAWCPRDSTVAVGRTMAKAVIFTLDRDGWSEKVEYGANHNTRNPAPDLTMTEIIATLSALSPHLNRRTLNQLAIIVEAVLAMTGRVTLHGFLIKIPMETVVQSAPLKF